MRAKLLLFVFISILTFQCGVLTEEGKEFFTLPLDDKVGIETEIETFQKKPDDCESNCASLQLSYEKAKNNERLNQAIEKAVISQLQYFVDDGDRIQDQERLANGFLADYEDFKKSFPEAKTPWNLEILGDVTYATDELISYRITINSYTGGAHTNEEVILINLDKNGSPVSFSSLIQNREKLMDLCETAFRKKKGLASGDDLGENGFNFEDNQFQLAENIGFGKRGLILYYNDYEIGSHADGPTEVSVSFEEITDVVKY